MMRARMSELELDDLGPDIWDELYPRAEAALSRGADVIVDAAKANLRKRRGTAKTASPEGEAPEYDEGELHDSVKKFGVRKRKYEIRQEYGSNHPASIIHEFGGTTKRGSVYPPRPWMRPAEAETEAEVEGILDAL